MDTTTGTFLARTASGATYEIDPDNKTRYRRWAAVDTDHVVDHTLRRDGRTVDLLRLAECTVGRRMIVLIDLHWKDVYFTTRMSTTVMAITPVVPDTPDHIGATGGVGG